MLFHKMLLVGAIFFSSTLQAVDSSDDDEKVEEKTICFVGESSESGVVVSEPRDFRKSLKEKYSELTNEKSQERAKKLYENYLKPKKKKGRRKQANLKQANFCLKESAKLGYVPAKLCLLRQDLLVLEKHSEDMSKELEAGGEKLGDIKKSTSILETNGVFMKLFHLEFDEISDIKQSIKILESSESEGVEFNYDYPFLRENDLGFLMFSEHAFSTTQQKRQELSLDELYDTLSKQVNSVKSFNDAHTKVKSKIENLKPGTSLEENTFVKEVQEVFRGYDRDFTEHTDKIRRDLSENMRALEENGEYYDSFDFDIHELEKKQKVFSENLFSIIDRYSDKKYAIYPSIFNGLGKLKEEVTSVCCSFSLDFVPDHDENFLSDLVCLYIRRHEEVPLESQSIKERITILREAQRYLKILLENPSEYLRVTNPRLYQLKKDSPDFPSFASTYRFQSTCGVYEPEFSESLRDLSRRVQTKLLKYYLNPVNERHPSYTTALRQSSIYRDLEAFIQLSEMTFAKFNSQTLSENIKEINESKIFYYYDGAVQQIWTHKKFPFFIRLNQEKKEYKVGFLKEHPYTSAGAIKMFSSGGKRWPLVTKKENELFKFSFLYSLIIPAIPDSPRWGTRIREIIDSQIRGAHIQLH